MGKNYNKTKSFVWLIVGLAMILAPMLYELITFFPMLDTVTNFAVIVMHLFFASAFLLLFSRSTKFKLSDLNMHIVVFLLLLFVPIGFAFLIIYPIVSSAMLLIYLLMYLVFTGGLLTLYTWQRQIRKLL